MDAGQQGNEVEEALLEIQVVGTHTIYQSCWPKRPRRLGQDGLWRSVDFRKMDSPDRSHPSPLQGIILLLLFIVVAVPTYFVVQSWAGAGPRGMYKHRTSSVFRP